MKKILLLLVALLGLGVSGAWADETYTIIDNPAGGKWPNGSYSSDNGSSTWKGSWTTNSLFPQITVSANTFLLQNSTGYIGSSSSKTGTFTISIIGGTITGYEITFYNVKTDGTANQTITPSDGGDAQTAEGTNSATVSVTGLNAASTTFTLTGENQFAKVTSFKIYYVVNSNGTWSSGVAANSINNHFSNVWYLKLKSPSYWDVFFDTFELTHRSSYSADDDITTYLAFTYNKFTSQYNHEANEFIAISTESISGHTGTTANTVSYTFPEKVRLNANETIYACFVSKNNDGTYNLQKRGVGVQTTSSFGSMTFDYGNDYSNRTQDNSVSNCQCHYTCSYSTSYDEYPSTRIWSGINYKDRTTGGKISIAYMKYTAPGTSGQFVHFDQFSLGLRNSDVVANTYLLFSKECLTGTGVTTSTEFEPSRFSAISTNNVPLANYGKVYTFTFGTDSYLDGGETYYVYMGTKQGNGNFCLQKYGLFINDAMEEATGFAVSSALETSSPTVKNGWQAVYYSNTCKIADSKVTVNVKEANNTIRTKTLYSDTNINLATALNIPTVYTITPSSITHVAGSSTQDVTIATSFTPSSSPSTENHKRYFMKLHEKYAGGANGKTLSASTDMSENDQWTIGGNYYDGYTFYNVGQGKYLSVSNGDDSQGTFVAEENASRFIAGTNSTGFGFRLLGSQYCYLNDHAGSSVLSTWKSSSAANNEGSLVIIENPLVSLLSDFMTLYNDISVLTGTTVGKYSNSSYTQDEIDEVVSASETAYTESNASDFITSFITLSDIKDGWAINQPATNKFYRFRNGDNYMCNVANGEHIRTVTETGNDASTIFYLDEEKYLVSYADGYGFNYGYCKATEPGIFNSFDFSESETRCKYLIHSNPGTEDNLYSSRYITVSSSVLAEGTGAWSIIEVTSLPITFKGEYASFYSPVDLEIPSGVKVYTGGSINGGWMTLNEVTGTLPANTGVILHYDGWTTETTINFNILSTSAAGGTGSLLGTFAAESCDANSKLVLGYEDSEWGIYKYSGTELGGFKAFMNVPAGVKGFAFNFADADAIVSVLNGEQQQGECYDLSGRRVSKPVKGMYIINGKKVIVK